MAALESRSRSSGSAERALSVLRELSRHARPVPAMLLARRCQIPRSSLHRLLNGLEEQGFIEYVAGPRGWSLGPEALRLGDAAASVHEGILALDAFDRDQSRLTTEEVARRSGLTIERATRALEALRTDGLVGRTNQEWALAARLSGLAARIEPLEHLRQVARPALIALRDATGETANLLVREGEQAIYIDQVLSLHTLRYAGWAGRSIPLHGTAAGAALTSPDSSPKVATDTVEIGVTAIASRVPHQHDPVAAVSVIAPTARLGDPKSGNTREAVRDAAQTIAAGLG